MFKHIVTSTNGKPRYQTLTPSNGCFLYLIANKQTGIVSVGMGNNGLIRVKNQRTNFPEVLAIAYVPEDSATEGFEAGLIYSMFTAAHHNFARGRESFYLDQKLARSVFTDFCTNAGLVQLSETNINTIREWVAISKYHLRETPPANSSFWQVETPTVIDKAWRPGQRLYN